MTQESSHDDSFFNVPGNICKLYLGTNYKDTNNKWGVLPGVYVCVFVCVSVCVCVWVEGSWLRDHCQRGIGKAYPTFPQPYLDHSAHNIVLSYRQKEKAWNLFLKASSVVTTRAI